MKRCGLIFLSVVTLILMASCSGGSGATTPTDSLEVTTISKTTNMTFADGSGTVTLSITFNREVSETDLENLEVTVDSATVGELSCTAEVCETTISGLAGCATLTDYTATIASSGTTLATFSFNSADDEFEWDPTTTENMFGDYSAEPTTCWMALTSALTAESFNGLPGFVNTTLDEGWQMWTFKKPAVFLGGDSPRIGKFISSGTAFLVHLKIQGYDDFTTYYQNGCAGFTADVSGPPSGPLLGQNMLGVVWSFDGDLIFSDGPWGRQVHDAANENGVWKTSDSTELSEVYFCLFKGPESDGSYPERTFISTDGETFTEILESNMTDNLDPSGTDFYSDVEPWSTKQFWAIFHGAIWYPSIL